jgi:hypothetical protein
MGDRRSRGVETMGDQAQRRGMVRVIRDDADLLEAGDRWCVVQRRAADPADFSVTIIAQGELSRSEIGRLLRKAADSVDI